MDPTGNRKSKQIQLSLVDVTLYFKNGEKEAQDTWQRMIPTEGTPGQAFHASCVKVLGLAPGEPLTDAKLPAGSVVTLAVEQSSFTVRDTQEKANMMVYKLISCKAPAAASVDDDEVLEALVGKTAKEAYDMRTEYKGTQYAQILGNKNTILAHFSGKLVLGKSNKFEKAS